MPAALAVCRLWWRDGSGNFWRVGFCFFGFWPWAVGWQWTSCIAWNPLRRANFYLKTRGESITDLYTDFKNGKAV